LKTQNALKPKILRLAARCEAAPLTINGFSFVAFNSRTTSTITSTTTPPSYTTCMRNVRRLHQSNLSFSLFRRALWKDTTAFLIYYRNYKQALDAFAYANEER